MPDIKDLAEHRSALLHIDPRKLQVRPGLNGRNMDSAEIKIHIEELAASIAENGVLTPLEVFNSRDGVFVTAGHCRLAATMLAISRGADIRTVPCITEAKGVNDASRILNQNISNSGRPLTPLEASYNIARAIKLGRSVADVAKTLGRSVSHVQQALSLQSADEAIISAVRDGDISATLATQIVKTEGENAAAVVQEAVTKAKSHGKKRVTSRTLKPLKPREAKKERPSSDVEIRPMPAGEMAVRFGERTITLSRTRWAEIAELILDAIEGKKVA